ncbi:MAG TPA: formylglycine-generating enzyme family protein [Leucothrix mucor]|uniref:Formylglycine-generating enzyme family protein n=1 Tax=Leucothrix mucor TaxID=45248 RepID=A0A7V2WV79_LEUMU|nr:formylglycine-generating enzyme family protein [Leucothrix mucor]
MTESIFFESQTKHLSELTTKQIINLQNETSQQLGLRNYFSDPMKAGGNAPEVAIIPAGLFEMGSNKDEFGHYKEEYPQHYIQIRKPFAIGRYAITAIEFAKFKHDTEWYQRPELLWAKENEPVMNIRLADMKLYLQWLSKQTGKKYRLPTEVEWEYAARAGTNTAFHFGETVSCKEVHFNSTAPYEEARQKKKWFLPRCFPMPKAIPVGSKPANSWGLHEVHGNVWEYTNSRWKNSHLNANRDGTDSNTSNSPWYVTKGGSWFDPAILSRSAARKKRLDDEMDTNLGFRILREL